MPDRLTDLTIPPGCASGPRPSSSIRQPCSQHAPIDPYPQAATDTGARQPCSRTRPTDRPLIAPAPIAHSHDCHIAPSARPPASPLYPASVLPCFRTRPSPHLHLEHLSHGSPRLPRYIDSVDVVQRPALYNGVRDSLLCRGPKEDAILDDELRTTETCIYYSVKIEVDDFDGERETQMCRCTGNQLWCFGIDRNN